MWDSSFQPIRLQHTIIYRLILCIYCHCGMILLTTNKNFILDVGMEKEQKQELRWRVSFLHSTVYCVLATHNYTSNKNIHFEMILDVGIGEKRKETRFLI